MYDWDDETQRRFVEERVAKWEAFWDPGTCADGSACTQMGASTLRDAVFVYLVRAAMHGVVHSGAMKWRPKHSDGEAIWFDPATFEFHDYEAGWV